MHAITRICEANFSSTNPSFRLAQIIFEPKHFLYNYPNNLIPVILPAYTAYEDGTEGF
jgi:hypothetical protein